MPLTASLGTTTVRKKTARQLPPGASHLRLGVTRLTRTLRELGEFRDLMAFLTATFFAPTLPIASADPAAGDWPQYLGPERNEQWRACMTTLAAATDRAPLRGDCVELGVGTGYWTAQVLDRVDRMWALDSSPEMLDLAKQRFADVENIEFETVDLWSWRPTRQWDSAAAFFFIEHVPDEVFPTLLETLHQTLRPGGCFFMAEGAWYQHEPQVETREIEGRVMRVVERRRSPDELSSAFERAGFDVDIGTVGDFVHLTAIRR